MSYSASGAFSQTWFNKFGPKLGLLLGVIAACVATGYYGLKARVSEPAQAPACYGRDRIVGAKEVQAQIQAARRPQDNVSEFTRGDRQLAERVRSVHALCRAEKCDFNALLNYKSALNAYLWDRYAHMTRLSLIQGEEGVRASRRIYGTAADREIEEGMRARHKAGLLRLNDFPDEEQRQAMAILIFRGAEAMRPCAKRG